MTEFDPAQHRMVPAQRWSEDFYARRALQILPDPDLAVFAAFQTASGDTHPVHYDVEYCRVRGMLTCCPWLPDPGTHRARRRAVPHIVEESLVGFPGTVEPVLEAGRRLRHYLSRARSHRPTGRTTGVVTLRSTVFNQRKELVLEGQQKFLIRRRPAQLP